MALNLGHDLLGNGRLCTSASGPSLAMRLNTAARAGFFNSVPAAFGLPSAFRKYADHLRRAPHGRIRGDQPVQAWRDGKALLREFDRRFEQLRPWQATVFLMGQLQRAQHARGAHRTPANLRLGERHRLAIGLQEQFFGGAGRCGFAAVVSAHGSCRPRARSTRRRRCPEDCGSTSVSTACIAMAASMAEPPRRSISRPASAASGLAAAAMCFEAWRVCRSVR